MPGGFLGPLGTFVTVLRVADREFSCFASAVKDSAGFPTVQNSPWKKISFLFFLRERLTFTGLRKRIHGQSTGFIFKELSRVSGQGLNPK